MTHSQQVHYELLCSAGASADAETGSREPDPSSTGSGPPGFDPARNISSCPFCARDGAFIEDDGDGYAFVCCTCTATGPLRKGDAEAVEAWNTRAKVSA